MEMLREQKLKVEAKQAEAAAKAEAGSDGDGVKEPTAEGDDGTEATPVDDGTPKPPSDELMSEEKFKQSMTWLQENNEMLLQNKDMIEQS